MVVVVVVVAAVVVAVVVVIALIQICKFWLMLAKRTVVSPQFTGSMS